MNIDAPLLSCCALKVKTVVKVINYGSPKAPIINYFHYCLCRDGSGCLYAVIQAKSRATPEQDRKLTNKAYHEEAGTERCTWLTLHPSEVAPTCRERPRVFPRFVFLFFFAHEPKGPGEYFSHHNAPCVGRLHSFVG